MHNNKRQAGFTYLGLLILVTIIGLVAVLSLQVGALMKRREAEQELLLIGKEYYDALTRYSDATPAGASPYPQRIDDLLRDPRYPNIKRHLRKLYIDPITGTNEWGVVYGSTPAGKGIVGIHSLSEATPIKKDNFDSPFEYMKNKKTYQDWVFTTILQPTDNGAAASPPANNNPGTPPQGRPKTPVAPGGALPPGVTPTPGQTTPSGGGSGPIAPVPAASGIPPANPGQPASPPAPGNRPSGPVPSVYMPPPTPVPRGQ